MVGPMDRAQTNPVSRQGGIPHKDESPIRSWPAFPFCIQTLNEDLMSVMSVYQEWTSETAVYPEKDQLTDFELNYLITGFVGEAGELANKYKKLLRAGKQVPGINITTALSAEDAEMLIDEAGDSLWYLARIFKVL